MKRIFWGVCCALSASMSIASSSAATMDTTYSGNWQIGAYSSDKTGQFNHCGMSARYNSGIYMLFTVGRNYNWGVAFANPAWHLTPGSQYVVKMSIDGGRWWDAEASVIGTGLAYIPLADSSHLFQLFRHGYQLHVKAAAQSFFFNLRGTAVALQKLLQCTQRHVLMASTTTNTNPFVSSGTASPKHTTVAESTTLAANLLSMAGITGFRILSRNALPPAWKTYDAVWVAPGLVGFVTVLDNQIAGSLKEIAALRIAADAKGCQGRFASGPISDEALLSGSQRFFTACDGSNGWDARYTVIPCHAGGYYFLATLTTEAAETKGDTANRSIVSAVQKTSLLK